MKTLAVIFTIVVVSVVLFAACGLRVITGSGQIRTESRDVSDFTEVNLSGAGELTIMQGESESLTIETDDNLLPHIETTVSRGVLTIGFDDDIRVPLFQPTKSIRYTLTVKTLTAVSLSGAGTIHADQLTAEELTLSNSGAGEITIDQLAANDLSVEISGAGSIEVAGEVTSQRVDLSGLGSYEGGDLVSQNADVTMSGAGSATVWVSEQLDAEMSGVGSVNYYGSPQVRSESSGIGGVKSLGDK